MRHHHLVFETMADILPLRNGEQSGAGTRAYEKCRCLFPLQSGASPLDADTRRMFAGNSDFRRHYHISDQTGLPEQCVALGYL